MSGQLAVVLKICVNQPRRHCSSHYSYPHVENAEGRLAEVVNSKMACVGGKEYKM
jgi:hypothetical protein